MRVEVYYNLHKKCLSVRALEGDRKGRVISHPGAVTLRNAKFVVQPAGRRKVLNEKRKNVHAFVRGELNMLYSKFPSIPLPDPDKIATYNPYKYETFVNASTGQPVLSADKVLINDKVITYE